MKKFTLILLATLATTAFANGSGSGSANGSGSGGNGSGGQTTQNDPTMQATMLVNTAVINSAFGSGGSAQQNLASNVGNFAPNGTEMQLVMAKNSLIMNSGLGGQAEQNIASNIGHEGLHSSTYQVAFIKDSAVINKASFGAKALQNLSSNSNCLTCSD
jgi:hypothetical protein